MEIRRFCNSILRKLWLIIIFGIIGGGLSFYSDYNNSIPIYEATTTIFTVTTSTNTLSANGIDKISSENFMISKEFVQDFHDLMMSEEVIVSATDRLKTQGMSVQNLIGMISLSAQKGSNIIRITASCDSPKKSALVANAISAAFIEKLNQITKTNIVGIISEAKEPLAPIEYNSIKGIVISILAGMIIAFLIIYIMELFDSRVRSVEDIEYNLNLQVLAQIPKYATK